MLNYPIELLSSFQNHLKTTLLFADTDQLKPLITERQFASNNSLLNDVLFALLSYI